jgi:hypothetical protein
MPGDRRNFDRPAAHFEMRKIAGPMLHIIAFGICQQLGKLQDPPSQLPCPLKSAWLLNENW